MMKWKVVKNPRCVSADRSVDYLRSSVPDSDPNNNTTKEQKEPIVHRKPDPISLKSFIGGLTRQRSDSNIDNVGLPEDKRGNTRRSRSEVRSCDRLAVGYHQGNPSPSRGWLRGRKKERDNPNGKTVVAGSSEGVKKNGFRTVLDQSGDMDKKKVSDAGIYAEIGVEVKKPNKAIKLSRKKGQAPKKPDAPSPKITSCDVNLNPKGTDSTLNCLTDKKLPSPFLQNTKQFQSEQSKVFDNRSIHTVKLNNLKNAESFLTVKNVLDSTESSNRFLTVAEIHSPIINNSPTSEDLNILEIDNSNDALNDNTTFKNTYSVTECKAIEYLSDSNENEVYEQKERNEELMEVPPYHIDTPDYSTLESEYGTKSPNNLSREYDKNEGKAFFKNSSNAKAETFVLPSILRDSSSDLRCLSESEQLPKKVVRFEKLDLIESYKKSKSSESSRESDNDNDSVISSSESKTIQKKLLDMNSNEVEGKEYGSVEDIVINSSPIGSRKTMTVNFLVRSPSPELQNYQRTQLVVKKSFVLTVAKQEKGFQSLCANKKSEELIPPPVNMDHKISVTFLCSPSENYAIPQSPVQTSCQRLRSMSVPPPPVPKIAEDSDTPVLHFRGRSRERRTKERHKKNHKTRKKDSSHHMPQAVIDELSQVLEKRKPSLEKRPLVNAT